MDYGAMAGTALLRKALIVALCVALHAATGAAFPLAAVSTAGAPADLQDQRHDAGNCCECCGTSDELYQTADCLALCVAAYALPVTPSRVALSHGHPHFRVAADRRKQRHTTPEPDPPNPSLGL
jgi:hypothetical protein